MTSGWVDDVRAVVDDRLRSYFQDKEREAGEMSPSATELVRAIQTLTMRGGKRLRPVVLVAGYRAAAGAEVSVERAGDAGAALELLQSYLLTHDDWMDGDDERRGGPSVHAALRQAGHEPHLADSLAILAGDLGCTFAWELLLRAPWPDGRRGDAQCAFLQIQKEVLYGQQLDLTGHPDVSKMHQLKTGSYTVRGPLRLGAILGDASGAELEALERFGRPLGEAFQLRDDLLGTFGDTKATGKPAGNDIRAGKHNALIAAATELLSDEDRATLHAALGNTEASDEEIARATELLVTSGARAQVERRLDELVRETHRAIDEGPFDEGGAQLLRDVSDKLTVRSH